MGQGRTAAVTRARQAKRDRDTARQVLEKKIEAALADYFQAVATAADIRSAARARSDAVLAAAEMSAAVPDDAVRDAVQRLRDLLDSPAEVAELCGLTLKQVTKLLSAGLGTAAEETKAVG